MKNTDPITLQRINQAHPIIREQLRQEYIEVSAMLPPFSRLRFAHVYRSPAEQRALFNKRPRVTRADSWQSIHNYGLAFDIVMLYDNDKNGTFEEASWDLRKDIDKDGTPEWRVVINFFKSKGWTWGGDWKSFPDAPHFEKNHGLTWQQMKARIDQKRTFIDSGITYINLP